MKIVFQFWGFLQQLFYATYTLLSSLMIILLGMCTSVKCLLVEIVRICGLQFLFFGGFGWTDTMFVSLVFFDEP